MKVTILSRLGLEAGGPSEETFYKVWDSKQREDYIKNHPGSKFAKNVKQGTSQKPSSIPSVKTPKPVKVTKESSYDEYSKKAVDSIQKVFPDLDIELDAQRTREGPSIPIIKYKDKGGKDQEIWFDNSNGKWVDPDTFRYVSPVNLIKKHM